MDEQARRATPPKRVRHPAGCSFASGCSPPRLATTQLPSATCVTTSHRSDFHLPDKTTSRTHSPAGLTRGSMDRRVIRGSDPGTAMTHPDGATWSEPALARCAHSSSPVLQTRVPADVDEIFDWVCLLPDQARAGAASAGRSTSRTMSRSATSSVSSASRSASAMRPSVEAIHFICTAIALCAIARPASVR